MKCHGYRKISLLTRGATTLGISSVQFSSVTQSCLTLWDPMNRSTPGLPVHHQLPEFNETRVHVDTCFIMGGGPPYTVLHGEEPWDCGVILSLSRAIGNKSTQEQSVP